MATTTMVSLLCIPEIPEICLLRDASQALQLPNAYHCIFLLIGTWNYGNVNAGNNNAGNSNAGNSNRGDGNKGDNLSSSAESPSS